MNIKSLSKELSISAIFLKNSVNNVLEQEIKNKTEAIISTNAEQVFLLYITFKENLIYDLTPMQFSDIFSQTVVFSLLFAKITNSEQENLKINTISNRFFDNFPLIKSLLQFFEQLDLKKYAYLRENINKICDVINNYNIKNIFTSDEDYVHFYEVFLTNYDKKAIFDRGIFYTPTCITEFIIRELDYLLKEYFYCEDGVRDSRINILDFACGTGSFLLELYKYGDLTNNIYGFELMIAPYIIAYLRLSQFLKLRNITKLPIFLTNTLENNKNIKFCSIPEIILEANKAQEIKNKNIAVVIGNPPYSIKSQNNNSYINNLVGEYFYINKDKIKNTQALCDDYIKFIRFAEEKIAKSPFGGIVAIVVNHGFIDNPSFKGMRHHLLNTFDDMYFIDLNGNFRRRKFTPDGQKDQNLFPIKQGICIAFFVKVPLEKQKQKNIYYTEIIADKQNKAIKLKQIYLKNKDLFKIANPSEPFYSFKPSYESIRNEYNKGIDIKNIFLEHGGGITTSRDRFAMDISYEILLDRFLKFKNSQKNEDLYIKFSVATKNGWDILKTWDKFQNYSDEEIKNLIKPIHFRGFDIRYIMYEPSVVQSMSLNIMRHLTNKNIALCFAPREIDSSLYSSVFITDKLLSFAMHYYGTKLAPLYLYKNGHKISNFKPEFLAFLQKQYNTDILPEKIFAYIYYALYNKEYCKKYVSFLGIDYPKIPFCETFDEINKFSKIGQNLIDIHLLKNIPKNNIGQFVGNNFIIDKINYKNGCVYINYTSYFSNVSEDVYQFKIGCYPVIEKYLKPRKGINIFKEIEYIQNIIKSISSTLSVI